MNLPKAIIEKIEDRYGIDYTILGNASIQAHINARLKEVELKSEADYFHLLLKSKDELIQFIEGLLVPETWFFRDKDPFQHLASWVKKQDKGRFLKILSAPCATGEEAYSIAMTLLDLPLPKELFHIYSFDLSDRFISFAKEGKYKRKSFRGLEFNEKRHHLEMAEDGSFYIKDKVKKQISFSQDNLLTSKLLQKEKDFDIIFCRNVLIYFNEASRKTLLDKIDFSLKRDGLLFLGHADNISSYNKFKYTGTPRAFAYEKNNGSKRLTDFRISRKKHKLRDFSTKQVNVPKKSLLKKSCSDPFIKAKEYADKGLFIEAESLSREHLRHVGPNPDAYFLLGQIHSAQENSAKAVYYYKKCLALKKNHSEAAFQLNLLKKGEASSQDAWRLRKKALKLNNPISNDEG